jgi:phosphatidylglycerophosphate synthase
MVPWILLSVRLLISPVLIAGWRGLSDKAVLWFYLVAFVTDYFDGVTARYFGTATRLLRRADSAADTIFHLALAFVILRRHPEEFHKSLISLVIFISSAVVWYVLDVVRWHRLAGFHAYSAKLFSIGLLVWMVILFGGRTTGSLLSIVLIFGAASNAEGILISLSLRRDRVDVPTIFHALRERRVSGAYSSGIINAIG